MRFRAQEAPKTKQLSGVASVPTPLHCSVRFCTADSTIVFYKGEFLEFNRLLASDAILLSKADSYDEHFSIYYTHYTAADLFVAGLDERYPRRNIVTKHREKSESLATK